ncbi:MAG TPA: PadR family transcriptional regulator [Methanotrichaceae archaeon]|nr:PadR family transcriptional regulator [Methanotrichaceae archaeon]
MTHSGGVINDNVHEQETKQGLYFEYYTERIIKTNLEIIILSMLRRNPMCGYDLIKIIFTKYNVFLSQGTVYPLLYSLKNEGILQAEFNPGNMRSKIYSITKEGETVVEDRLNEFIRAEEYILNSIILSNTQNEI